MPFTLNPLYRCIHSAPRIAALATLSAVALASSAAEASAGKWAPTQTAAYTVQGGKLIGSLANGELVHVGIGLSLNNRSGLESFLANQARPGSPSYHQFLSSVEFVKLYSPTEAQAKEVTDYLTASGFTNVRLAANRLIITADGTAASARAAFDTDFSAYDYQGKTVFANTRPASVPSKLGDIVLSVVGLQNADHGHTMVRKVSAAAPDAAPVAFYPTQFPQLYDAGFSATGSTVPVAVFATGNLTQTLSDLALFESAHGLPSTPTTVEPVDGSSSSTSGTDEWDIDSQDILGVSGGVASITFYSGPSLSFTDMDDEFNQIVMDNTVPAINVSIGGCEISAKTSGATATSDEIFMEADAQGQSFFISSGDSGSAECGKIPGQSWPAISPYVTAVGGTSLLATSAGTYKSESVWKDAGGGPSVTEPKPSYQANLAGVSYNSRGVPDIAMDADPYTGIYLVVDGTTVCCYGGTSLAAPLSVGTWSRVIAEQGNFGFAAPIFYNTDAAYSGAFHDIVKGSNGGYTAAKGWDYASGIGSLDINALAADLTHTNVLMRWRDLARDRFWIPCQTWPTD